MKARANQIERINRGGTFFLNSVGKSVISICIHQENKIKITMIKREEHFVIQSKLFYSSIAIFTINKFQKKTSPHIFL